MPDGSFYSVSDFDEVELNAGLRRSVLSLLVRRYQLPNPAGLISCSRPRSQSA